MAWSGSGVFNRLYSWVTDRDNHLFIDSTRMDAEFANYKSGLENCLTLTGETTPTAAISFGSQRITSLAAGTASTDAVNKAQAEAMAVGNASSYAVDTGSANAYVITPTPAISAYAAGQTFKWIAVNANTGSSTLNVSGQGVKTIKTFEGATLASGQIAANSVNITVYDGTDQRLVSSTRSPGIDDNATGEILDLTDTDFSASFPDGTFNINGRRTLLTSTSTGSTAQLELVDQDNDATRAVIHAKGNAGAVEALWVGSTGNVGTGTAAPAGKFHAKTAASSATPGADFDEGVFENSANAGISILAGTTGTAGIAFGDSGDADVGKVVYNHATDTLGITAGATDVVSVASTGLTVTSTDAGSAVGPLLILDRNSASPADNDSLGQIIFRGRDDGAASTNYGAIKGVGADVNDGTGEDGKVVIQTIGAGSFDDRLTVQLGTFIGAPTGSDKGAGTLNVEVGHYINGNAIVGLRPGTVLTSAYATSSAATGAHGLGATPHIVLGHLVCTTTDAGYAVGDIVNLGASDSGTGSKYITFFADGTNVGWATSNTAINLANKTGTTVTTLTAASWNLVVRSYLVA